MYVVPINHPWHSYKQGGSSVSYTAPFYLSKSTRAYKQLSWVVSILSLLETKI